jgi:hypothetical protein
LTSSTRLPHFTPQSSTHPRPPYSQTPSPPNSPPSFQITWTTPRLSGPYSPLKHTNPLMSPPISLGSQRHPDISVKPPTLLQKSRHTPPRTNPPLHFRRNGN